MKVERERLLKTLDVAVVGTSPREILEQSNSFVFTDEHLITFNGEIFTRVDNPLPEVRGAVPAEDFRQILHKFPDDMIEVFTKDGEVRIKGSRKQAGLTRQKDIGLLYGDVPKPGDWSEPPPEFMGTILQAARVCGRDDSQPRTTEVHVTSKYVEASDSYRFFRCTMETGFDKELLIPAISVNAVGSLAFEKVSVKGGWLHLRRRGGHRVSLRCSKGEYLPFDKIIQLKDPKKVRLPANLSEVLARAEVMQDSGNDAMVSIRIEDGKLTLKAKKDTGWYEESRDIKYSGERLSFDVNPAFLEEILTKTRTVRVSGSRMKIEAGDTIFIVCLDVERKEEDKERRSPAGAPTKKRQDAASERRRKARHEEEE